MTLFACLVASAVLGFLGGRAQRALRRRRRIKAVRATMEALNR